MAPRRIRRGARKAPLRCPRPAGDAPSTPVACRGPRRCATLWKRRDEAAPGDLDHRAAPDQRRAIGSAGERLVHTEEVTGSIPVSPTRSEAMWVSLKLPVGAIPVAKWSASGYARAYDGPAWLGRRQHLLRSLGGVPRPRYASALRGPLARRSQSQARS